MMNMMTTSRCEFERVIDLMRRQKMELDSLADRSGVERTVVEAIACQRYTPSPEQRKRVSGALGVRHDQIMWGHACAVEEHIHEPI